MTERKEKTMLKWLKQKPTHGHGGLPIEKITDDPLATIQVHPHAKKSKNKANEIYAVSRVNPLFEEEDGKEVFSPGGNSGSSGYDSGSGPSDDDFPIISNVATDLKDLQANILGRLSSSSSSTTLSSSNNNNPSNIHAIAAKHPQLFINTENDVIHHEAAIVGPNGRPILQILEQNPNYVKSIALSVGNNGRKRPLSPISESAQQQNANNTASSALSTSSSAQQLNTHMVRSNSANAGYLHKDAKPITLSKLSHYHTVDAIGSAKLIKKDSQYVRSIRIGVAASSNTGTGGTKRSILEANRRFSSSSSSSSSGPSRRPSVTFADDVGNAIPGGSRPGSRKPSMEQDSIVTESLLMMTSHGAHEHARRLTNASTTSNNSSSTANSSRKTSVSSSQSKSQDEHSTTAETDIVSSEDTVDLEAFANSLRKSRPIKQLSSPTTKAHIRSQGSNGSKDDLDDTSSSSSNPSEGYDLATPPNERRAAALDIATELAEASPPSATSTRIHASKAHKSPFGGIADHYAAAKEIAKEIESYSNGSAKASTKKSLVRDLLYRGNRNASSSVFSNYEALNAIKAGSTNNSTNTLKINSNFGTINEKNGFRTERSSNGNNKDGTITKDSRHHSSSSSSNPQPLYDQQMVLASSPIYHDPSYGEVTSIAKNGNNTTNNRRTGSNNASTPQHHEVVTTLRGGGSNDWELVRVQQVYVKATGSSSQDQLSQHMGQKLKKNGDILNSKAKDSNGRTVAHQGHDYSSNVTAASTSTNSRRHPSSSLATSTTPKASSSLSSTTRGKASKKVPINDDGLSTAGARQHKPHDDTDSGNSSDRTYAEVRLEIEGTKIEFPGEKITDSTIQVEDDSSRPENLPSKVMIVTGDSQNIVVDLSGVPLDLKNAIVSGTALITLPDGLDKILQPGYTMITIPASKPTSSTISSHTQLVVEDVPTSSKGSNTTGGTRNNLSKKDGVMNITIGIDDDKPLVPAKGGSSANSSDDEYKLFSTKNKTQIWDVIQQTMGIQLHETTKEGKAKKKITTVFPFHPNQDAYESPDFTIEGHRMDRQRKKVEKEKKRRCACRLCGMLFFLVAFLGVLVALSMIYTKGQRYFGSV